MALALYLAVTLAVCALLRRLVPWRPALVLIALPFVFTGAALLTNRTYAPLDLLYTSEPFRTAARVEVRNSVLTDVSHQIIPWNLAVRDAIRAGEWPLWNRLMLSGDVLAASGQPAPYSPVTILGLLLPLAHALTFAAAIGFFIAGLGAYLYFRRLLWRADTPVCEEESQTGVSALHSLSESACVFGAAAWMYATPVVFYLEWPLGASLALLPLVLFGAEWLLEDAIPGALALTIALSLLILAGHPESVLHVVGAGAAYTAIRMVMLRAYGPRTIAAGILAGAGALAITAIYLLPIQDALPQTVQYGFRREVFARMDRSVPWPEAGALALRTFVPFRFGRLVHDVADDAPMRYWLSDSGYAGSVVLALAVFGVIRSRRRERWLLLGMAVFGLLAGSDAPVVSDLLAMLPLFKIALNERLVVLCAFGLVALAALGVEALPGQRMDKKLTIVSLATAAALGIVVALSWSSMRAANLTVELLAKNAAYLLVPLLVLPFLRSRVALIVLLLLGQRWLEMGDFWPVVDPALAAPKLALVERLPRGGEPYRVVGLGPVLPPNGSAYFGLEDVRGYQAMNLTFFHDTYGLWSEQPPVGANVVNDLGAPFLSLMNVRYAFVSAGTVLPEGWTQIGAEGGYAIARNSRALPRAFIPKTVNCGASTTTEMIGERDFATRGWLRGDCPRTPLANGAGTVRTRQLAPGRLAIEVTADASSWVFVTEPAWRGWKAVDSRGRRLPLRRANHAFLAFQVEAGRTEVELIYRPRSFVIGAWVSAVALALLGLFVTLRLSRRIEPRNL